jgi:Ni,Fe-hydrogenase I small subunit
MISSRRDFVRLCTLAAAAIGLGPLAAQRCLEAAARGIKPSVIWLQFQECTGGTGAAEHARVTRDRIGEAA